MTMMMMTMMTAVECILCEHYFLTRSSEGLAVCIVPEIGHAIVPASAILQFPSRNLQKTPARLALGGEHRLDSDILPQRDRLPDVVEQERQGPSGDEAAAGTLDNILGSPDPGRKVSQQT